MGNGVRPITDCSRSVSGCDDHVGATVVVVGATVVVGWTTVVEVVDVLDVVEVNDVDDVVVVAAGVQVNVREPLASFSPVVNDGDVWPVVLLEAT